ncbi:MAG: SBBP repeat-containing protein, partial [Kiritimatiellia bacterium]
MIRTQKTIAVLFVLIACSINAARGRLDADPGSVISSARVPFVANEGQVDNPGVKFYARTFGGTVYALSGGRIVYSLPKFEAGRRAGAAALSETFRGAVPIEPAGSVKSAVAVSSFIGGRPELWKSDLPAFDRLDLGELYPGIGLSLSARGNNVEKIFTVAPGADPRAIAMVFGGAHGVEVTADGELEVMTALGPVYFTRPVAWQMDEEVHGSQFTVQGSTVPPPADGQAVDFKGVGREPPAPPDKQRRCRDAHALPVEVASRQNNAVQETSNIERFRNGFTPVEVAYAVDEDGSVRFEIGAYDRSRALVIDPLLASTFIGGGGADAVQAMAVDAQTNVYVAGYTDSSDFPVTVSPVSPAPA